MKNKIILIVLILLTIISVFFTITGYIESKKNNEEANNIPQTNNLQETTKDSYDLVNPTLLYSDSFPTIVNNKLYFIASGYTCLSNALTTDQYTEEDINT